ncbi:GNAT family N-acetyltransferase, partial [Desulfobacterales bacterium HSG17]|nr:GNAT family N-acetyltransferase [Desulfobacterales bacterium HSG17]
MNKEIIVKGESYIVRAYQPNDEKRILALWESAFDKNMPVELWQWKYINNPYRQHMLLCENEKGNIVVLYGGIPYKANLRGKEAEFTHLMDIMSHPDYRKTGLFVKTANMFFDSVNKNNTPLFLYGFPGELHFKVGKRFLRYKALTGGVDFLTIRTNELAANNSERIGKIEH